MDYKTKSIAKVIVLIGFMSIIAVFINDLDLNITGSVVRTQCKCADDIECNDNNLCTEDICLYKESCGAAVCVNTKIPSCQ